MIVSMVVTLITSIIKYEIRWWNDRTCEGVLLQKISRFFNTIISTDSFPVFYIKPTLFLYIPSTKNLLSSRFFFQNKMMLIFLPLVKNRCRCFYSFIICCIISRKRLLFCQDSSFFVRASHNFFMTPKSLLLKITI